MPRSGSGGFGHGSSGGFSVVTISLKELFAFVRGALSARNLLKVTECLDIKLGRWCFFGLKYSPCRPEKRTHISFALLWSLVRGA